MLSKLGKGKHYFCLKLMKTETAFFLLSMYPETGSIVVSKRSRLLTLSEYFPPFTVTLLVIELLQSTHPCFAITTSMLNAGPILKVLGGVVFKGSPLSLEIPVSLNI